MDLRHSLIAKLFRYASVSVATTALSLTVLSILVAVVHLEAVRANVIATICGIGPSYYLNRRWVWKHPESKWGRHVVPFWAMSLAGLLLSSISVHVADRLASHLTADLRTVAILAANVTAFGTLWIVQFLIIDRLLFKKKKTIAPGSALGLGRTLDEQVPRVPQADHEEQDESEPRVHVQHRTAADL